MEVIETFFGALGLKLKVVIAGAVGAFVSLRFFDGLKPTERWLTFMGGWGGASYVAIPLADWLELKSPTWETGLSLIIGMFGMSLAAAVIKVIRETDWPGFIRQAFDAVLRRKGGGGS